MKFFKVKSPNQTYLLNLDKVSMLNLTKNTEGKTLLVIDFAGGADDVQLQIDEDTESRYRELAAQSL